MKYIMPARLELGIPTIMNLTGPLIHPMALETQLLGISRPELLESTAQVLKNMGRKRAIVVAGPEGLDEAGLNGTTKIALLGKWRNHLCQASLQRIWGWNATLSKTFEEEMLRKKCRDFA